MRAEKALARQAAAVAANNGERGGCGVLLRDVDVARRLAIHRVSVWRWSEKGILPPPVRLTSACTRWREADIEAFLAERLAERDASARRGG